MDEMQTRIRKLEQEMLEITAKNQNNHPVNYT